MIENIQSKTDLSGIYVVYDGSTLIESNGTRGFSHFMEHLVCKPLDKYENDFFRLGMSTNAYTTSDKIVFYLTGLESSVSKYRNKFVDELLEYKVNKKEFEDERKIIIEEYSDTFTNQGNRHYYNLFRKKLDNFMPIGYIKDIKKVSYLDGIDFFKKQYIYPSRIINIHGNGGAYENNSLIFNDLNIDNYSPYILDGSDFFNRDFNNELELDTKFSEDKVSIILTSNPITDIDDILYVKFINMMLCSGLQSPLMKEIREKRGLCYNISCYLDVYADRIGYNSISTMSGSNNVELLIEQIDSVMRSKKKFMTRERFNVIKEYLAIDNKVADINRYQRPILNKNKKVSLFYNLDRIDYDILIKVYDKYFNIDNYYISRDDKEFK